MKPEELANAYHDKGFNCAQSVLAACCAGKCMDEGTAYAVASCFGGGMRTGGVCGAVTGALMAIGTAHPLGAADIAETRRVTSEKAVELQRRFEEEFGALDCRDLLAGIEPGAPRPCPRFIEAACRMALELM